MKKQIKKKEIKLPDTNEVLKEIVEDFNFNSGPWTVLASGGSKSAGFIELPDGRKAQVQVVVETDEDEFI